MSSENQLIVWQIPLDISGEDAERLYEELSEKEKEQANRFRFAMHRYRYVAAQYAMRKILTTALAVEMDVIHYLKNKHGKPFIEDNPIFFNLTHSEEIGLLAVSQVGAVGVDIEFVKRDIDFLGIAKRFFHPIEVEQLLSVPESEQVYYFYRCWTAKEAFLKTNGVGIATNLMKFAVNFLSEKTTIQWVDEELSEFSDWSVFVKNVHKDYVVTAVTSFSSSSVVLKNFELSL